MTLDELAPSAKLVAKALEHEGPLTQKDLAATTRMNRRTVRWALTRLENADVVESEPNMMDLRQSYYTLAEDVEMCNTAALSDA